MYAKMLQNMDFLWKFSIQKFYVKLWLLLKSTEEMVPLQDELISLPSVISSFLVMINFRIVILTFIIMNV